MDYYHNPILLNEAMKLLDPQPGGVYVDATLGGGGHFKEIISRVQGRGTFIGIDQDAAAIEKAKQEIKACNVRFVRDNFRNLRSVITSEGFEAIDGIMFDLGVSSYQLDEGERGFSYMQDAPLDMRMDQRMKISAWEVVNQLPKEKLKLIIQEYGEESWAGRIAQFIDERRSEKSIDTTSELVDIIKDAIPAKFRRKGPHPAKRTFQALRIYVNDELDILRPSLQDAIEILRPGGNICVITFHSLEDRIVKNIFRELATDCICPPHSIICNCNHKRSINILTSKPICPTQEEIEANPRSRSAKLRAAQRV